MDANEQATFRAGLAELLQDYVGKESVRAALGLPQKPWLAKRRRVLAGAGKGQELVPAQQQLTQRYIKLLSISDDDENPEGEAAAAAAEGGGGEGAHAGAGSRQQQRQRQRQQLTEAALAALLLHCGPHPLQAEWVEEAVVELEAHACVAWDALLPLLLAGARRLEAHLLTTSSSPSASAYASAMCSVEADTLLSDVCNGGGTPSPLHHILRGGSSVSQQQLLKGPPSGQQQQQQQQAPLIPGSGGAGSMPPASTVTNAAGPEPRNADADEAGAPPRAASRDAHAVAPWLRPLVCRVTQLALQQPRQPCMSALTCFELYLQLLTWLRQHSSARVAAAEAGAMGQAEEQKQQQQQQLALGETGTGGMGGSSEREGEVEDEYADAEVEAEWVNECVAVIRQLTDGERCLVPFYALLHDRTQLPKSDGGGDSWSVGLWELEAEVQRRRDRIGRFMTVLDAHLHCPTFATLRPALLVYYGSLGEPLRGLDVVEAVPPGSLEWERALRCLRHALRCSPPADWWRKVLVHASSPSLRQQGAMSAAAPRSHMGSLSALNVPEFSSRMMCRALVGRTLELLRPPTQAVAASGGGASVGTGAGVAGAVGAPGGGDASSGSSRWQEWLALGDVLYYILRCGYVDFIQFVDELAREFAAVGPPKSNYVTWLLATIYRLDTVATALTSGPRTDTVRKILSFHVKDPARGGSSSSEGSSGGGAQAVLLEYVGSIQVARLWLLIKDVVDSEAWGAENIKQGKHLDEWWRSKAKGEGLDYASLDDPTTGMVWAMSHMMSQPVCDSIIAYLRSAGVAELLLPGPRGGGAGGAQPGERCHVIQETKALSVALLQGLSLQSAQRAAAAIEDIIAAGQVVPSVSMVETYVRLLLVAPQTMHHQQTLHQPHTLHEGSKRPHIQALLSKYQAGVSKNALPLVVLEILNYRLLPFFRYHGRVRGLLMETAKLLITLKGVAGQHRLFRLAENLAMNLILSLREIALIKRELKASSELSETLNRFMVMNLAMMIKTRGVAEFEQMLMLEALLEQVLADTTYAWSDKTLRYFPGLLRDVLAARPNRKAHNVDTWLQVEAVVLHECRQLLGAGVGHDGASNGAACAAYLSQAPAAHRRFLCAAAWMLMDGRPDSINFSNLKVVLNDFSPQQVTDNVYVLVDVLLHNIQVRQQQGTALQDLLLPASAALAAFMWGQELLPFDIVLLALADRNDSNHSLRLVVGLLIDRAELKHKVQQYCASRTPRPLWQEAGPWQRPDVQQALGAHLAGRDRYPIFFDHLSLRAVPAIQLIVQRLIESGSMESADRLLVSYSTPPMAVLTLHPTRFTFVRNTLAYFYPLLPRKLIIHLLNTLDIPKVPFSPAFLLQMRSPDAGGALPGPEYFSQLLASLATHVVPPLHGRPASSSELMREAMSAALGSHSHLRAGPAAPGGERPLLEHIETGTYVHLALETAAMELLSLSLPADEAEEQMPRQIVAMLVAAAISPSAAAAASPSSVSRAPHGSAAAGAGSAGAGGPGGGGGESGAAGGGAGGAAAPAAAGGGGGGAGTGAAAGAGGQAAMTAVTAAVQPLMVQACALLLAQLPAMFQTALYRHVVALLRDMPLLTAPSVWSGSGGQAVLDLALAGSLWSAGDNTSTRLGRLVALVHALLVALPYQWLEGAHALLLLQRPLRRVSQLRVAYRLMGPLLPRVLISRQLYAKTLALLWLVTIDVLGEESQVALTGPASALTDIVDFMHHAVALDGTRRNQPVRRTDRDNADTLLLCSTSIARLRPDLRHAFRHLSIDPSSSIYAATNLKLSQKQPSGTPPPPPPI